MLHALRVLLKALADSGISACPSIFAQVVAQNSDGRVACFSAVVRCSGITVMNEWEQRRLDQEKKIEDAEANSPSSKARKKLQVQFSRTGALMCRLITSDSQPMLSIVTLCGRECDAALCRSA